MEVYKIEHFCLNRTGSTGVYTFLKGRFFWNMSLPQTLTWNLKVCPFLMRTTESVHVLQEVTGAGHQKLIASFLCVTARVKLHRQVDRPGDVHFILKPEKECWECFLGSTIANHCQNK